MKRFYHHIATPFPELYKRIKKAFSARIEDPSLPHILISTPSHRRGYLKSTVHQYDRTNPDQDTLTRLVAYSELIKESKTRCLCNPDTSCLLYLRNYDSIVSLAKHPGTKGQHCPTCGFAFSGALARPQIGGLTFSDVQTQDVSTKGLLASPKRSARKKGVKSEKKKQPSQGKRALKASQGTGALLAIMNAAGLNEYEPKRGAPTWPEAAARLARAAEITQDDDAKLRANLVIAGHDNEADVRQRLASMNSANPLQQNGILLVGRLIGNRRHSTKGQRAIQFDGWDGLVIAAATSIYYGARHSTYRGANSVIRSLGATGNPETIVILVASLNANEELVGTKLSYVMTSEQYIPVVSGFELEFARHLVELGHHFLKPIRRTDSSPHIYDFLIYLSSGPYPVEVNGMETEEYVAGKDRTEADLISSHPNHHAIWWAIRKDPLPHLPDPES